MRFDTKIAIVLRDDLAPWQGLNVTAFLAGGLFGTGSAPIGAPYGDAAGNAYSALPIQPVIVLAASGDRLGTIHRRALDRGVPVALYIEDMFATGHDEANRATVAARRPEDMLIAGLALREERKLVDRIVKGAKMHP